MKKQLHTTDITNELAGASAFFPKPPPPPSVTQPTPKTAAPVPITAPTEPPASALLPVARNQQDERAVAPFRERPKTAQTKRKASVLARYPASIIERIRKAVKNPGREVTFVRLTVEEKRQLAEIVYSYKRQGVKTSENEISRIAMSYLLEDYHANRQGSILAEVIAALLA